MIGARPRYGRIEQLTDTLLAQAGVSAPEVPVARIISTRGITIDPSASLGDVSGLVLRRGGEIIIGVNKKQAPARQRFTLAHELAHALLHPGKEVRFDKDFRVNLRSEASGLGVDVEEIEANFFAACLLMPRRFLQADPEAALVDVEDAQAVARLAKRYGVSAHAMSIRLGNLAPRRS
jgi:Zn-dependent peptidase ImmA (M78 family)